MSLLLRLYQVHDCVSQVGKAAAVFSHFGSASPLPACCKTELWTNKSLSHSLTHSSPAPHTRWTNPSVPLRVGGALCPTLWPPPCKCIFMWIEFFFFPKSIVRGLIPWNMCIFHLMPVDPPMVWNWKAALDMTAAAFDEVPTLKLLIAHIGTATLPLCGDNSSVNQSQSTASQFTWYVLWFHHISSHTPPAPPRPVWIKRNKREDLFLFLM